MMDERAKKSPMVDAIGPWKKAGNNLLSRLTHYHGPRMLNGRVRNGNGCLHPGKLTGKLSSSTFNVRTFKV
jgi:hypothetical protein